MIVDDGNILKGLDCMKNSQKKKKKKRNNLILKELINIDVSTRLIRRVFLIHILFFLNGFQNFYFATRIFYTDHLVYTIIKMNGDFLNAGR